MRYLTLLLLIFSLCTSAVTAEPPHPPFRKVWSYKTDKQIFSSIFENNVNNKILCYYTDEEYGAVDIDTGKCLWKKPVGENHIMLGRCQDGKFQIVLEQYHGDPKQWHTGKGMLYVLDPQTGNEISTMPVSGMSCCPEIKDGILYCLFEANKLTAIEIDIGKKLWTSEFQQSSDGYRNIFLCTSLKAVGNNLFIKKGNKELLCVDSASGKIRWSIPFACDYPSYVTDHRRVYILQGETITAHNIDNGAKEWDFNSNCRIENRIVSSENLLVFIGNDGILYALGAEDGKELWSQKLPPADYRIFSSISLIEGSIVLSIGQHFLAFDQKGRKMWEFDSRIQDIDEIIKLDRGYLFDNAFSLLRYEEGKPSEVPDTVEGKKALAEKLVSRFDDLDEDEKYLLGTLGDQAFDALLSLVKKHLSAYENAPVKKISQQDIDVGAYEDFTREYFRLDYVIDNLKQVTSTNDTHQLFSLLSTVKKPLARYRILYLLSEKGDENITIPYFINEIKKIKDKKDRLFFVALHAIENSSNKAAVDFMIDKLSDPKASKTFREAAYLNLGRTGGERGARAVIKARDERRTIPSIEDFAGFDKLSLEVEEEKEPDPDNRLVKVMDDGSGRIWGLTESYVLGSFMDIWLLQSDGQKWKKAYFAGTMLDSDSINPASVDIKKLVDNINGVGILLDSDKDGWTDLVEKRLGTDPNNKDTDGDGLIDSEDKNPLAAPRPLNEEEKILRAAFEARYCFSSGSGYKTPCLIELPEGVQPFEFYGFNWVIIPQVKGTESRLAKYRSLILHRGMAIVHFSRPRFDFDDHVTPETKGRDFILWNADRTEAKLSISTHYGPLNAAGYDIHLKKFGDEWIVIRIMKTWVS